MRITTTFGARAGRLLAAPLAAFALVVALPACAQQEASAADAAQAQDQGQADPNTVVGRVQGQQITLSELETVAGEQLTGVEAQLRQCERQAEQSRFQVLQGALQEEIQRRLVAAEAEKAGQSPDEYLAANLQVPPVTDADVEAFYNENKPRIGERTLEQVGPQIRQYLEQQNRAQTEQAFYSGLADKYEVDFLLEPPRTQVAAEGPAKGPADAPVTIVEFSDFECPFCSRVNPTLDQVRANYGDKVRIVFRQFPLNIHPNAQKAAEASLCAHDQGKFWEMHDLMFAEQRQLTVENLKEKATRLELDTEAFNQCLDSGKYAARVQADMQAGVEAGVSGTPAMFINGIPVSGAVPYEQLSQVIDAELDRKGVED